MVKTKNRVYRYHLTIYLDDKDWPCVSVSPADYCREALEVWFNDNCKKWVFQLEESKNGMMHYQCVISLIKKEFSKKVLSSISSYTGIKEDYINISPSLTGNTSFCYAMKGETRVDGPWSNKMLEENLPVETLAFGKFYNWQKVVFHIAMGKPDDRSIHWFYDTEGNRGKTQLTRMLLVNHGKEVGVIPCVGSSSQLISAVINMGMKKTYILDIPRAKSGGSWDDRIADLMITIESIKNGLLVSAMYGKINQLIMPHPNVIVFSNYDLNGLSADRWKKYDMDTMSPEDWAQELLLVQPDQISPKEERRDYTGDEFHPDLEEWRQESWYEDNLDEEYERECLAQAEFEYKEQEEAYVLQCNSMCKDNHSYLNTLKSNVQDEFRGNSVHYIDRIPPDSYRRFWESLCLLDESEWDKRELSYLDTI